MKTLATVTIVGALTWLSLFATTAYAQAPAPKKLAFLVGVSEYQRDGLTNLNFSDDDIEELANTLKSLGFETDVLLREQATLKAIQTRFDIFAQRTKNELRKEDVVFVALSGHGLQKEIERDGKRTTEAYFCPYDASKFDNSTLLSINNVMRALETESSSSQNLLVIDACRDDPARGAKGIDGSTAKELPAKLSVLFACSANQRSFESAKIKHGVFTHFMIEGLRGGAFDRQGELTWLDLASYVQKAVPRNLRNLIDDEFAVQRPNLLGNLESVVVLGRGEPAATEPLSERSLRLFSFGALSFAEWQAEVAKHLNQAVTVRNSLGMELVLIPPVTSLPLGVPAGTAGANPDEQPMIKVEVPNYFRIARHEVTQAQWSAVMGTLPSYFQATGDGATKVAGEATSELPVEMVSWDLAVEFCRKLTAKERVSGAIRASEFYRLPHEIEWEYVARYSGTGIATPPAEDAFWNLNSSDGRPHSVDTSKPNSLGLYDLFGNVAEWCWNDYYADAYAQGTIGRTASFSAQPENGKEKVVRGGSWIDGPARCRLTRRTVAGRTTQHNTNGFRVVLATSKP